jgi:hypothetical protein
MQSPELIETGNIADNEVRLAADERQMSTAISLDAEP